MLQLVALFLACSFAAALSTDEARHNRATNSALAPPIKCDFTAIEPYQVTFIRENAKFFSSNSKNRYLKIVPDAVHGLKAEVYRVKTSWFSKEVTYVLRSVFYLDDIVEEDKYLIAPAVYPNLMSAQGNQPIKFTASYTFKEGKALPAVQRFPVTLSAYVDLDEPGGGFKAIREWDAFRCLFDRAVDALRPQQKEAPRWCDSSFELDLARLHGKPEIFKLTSAQRQVKGYGNLCAPIATASYPAVVASQQHQVVNDAMNRQAGAQ